MRMTLPVHPRIVLLPAVLFLAVPGMASAQDGVAPQKVAASAAIPAAATVPFVAHRAVYDLNLDRRKDQSSVDSMRGRIVYDFSGNACSGYALNFRQVTEIGLSGGGVNTSDLRSTTFEDEKGRNFRFNSQNFTNQKLDGSVDGQASRAESGAVGVALKKPKSTKFDLSERVLFPTGQMKAIVMAARAGEHVFESQVYDGSDGGQKIYNTLAVIGAKIGPDKPREGVEAKAKQLDGVDRWPVTISYFDPTKKAVGEETPVYTMSFELYADGISGSLTLDYGDFRLKGTMVSLDFLPQTECK
ncbi:cell envelope integrity EipB family protein [Labrys sp. WJW]|uniref:cell envelope integrity EipB family protein n=1 Tax=Labrys sp. WJW TaxID=1737983 RepID=UPI000AB8DAEC|nr:cell envelope integrity EipB family protein [Labrys sp. WJW]